MLFFSFFFLPCNVVCSLKEFFLDFGQNFCIIDSMKKLILASASPRRKEALKKLHIPFLSIPNNVDEEKETKNLKIHPEDFALYLSKKKAETVSTRYPADFILGMDTIVVLDEEIIGKPKDKKDAIGMLWKLNGRWHRVITGITLVNEKMLYKESKRVITDVKFFRHKKTFIKEYVAKGESLDKAGGYGIQLEGRYLVEKIKGDYSNVVGFPEETVLGMLKRAEIIE